MKKYQIQIKGMHCSGCKNLLQMLLEEREFQKVEVNQETNIGVFETELPENEIKKLLDEAFAEAGEKYSYTQLTVINS
jgi:copper chaperone CopZ